MRGHNSFLIIITPKVNISSFKKSEKKHSKIRETGSEGYFSALYVIIDSPSPTPLTCYTHYIPQISNLFLLPPTLNPPPPSPHWDWYHDDNDHRHYPPTPLLLSPGTYRNIQCYHLTLKISCRKKIRPNTCRYKNLCKSLTHNTSSEAEEKSITPNNCRKKIALSVNA